MKAVDLFHIGPQKSGTTWVYRSLKEHPEIATSSKDSIHYFDMFYSKGDNWYKSQFTEAKPHQKLFDPTPSYLRSSLAPKRIFAENSTAKIVVCLRHPINRAFSHYWHEKKKRKYNFSFEEVLSNYDLFSSWIETGFYAEHIERYLSYFPREQILLQKFEDLQNNPQLFLRELFTFMEVNVDFLPSTINRKINVAGKKRTIVSKLKSVIGEMGSFAIPGIWNDTGLAVKFSGKEEYLSGIDEDVYKALEEIYFPEIKRLENLLGISLDEWK